MIEVLWLNKGEVFINMIFFLLFEKYCVGLFLFDLIMYVFVDLKIWVIVLNVSVCWFCC